jgi:C-terminal processing protease CtpA/Prc
MKESVLKSINIIREAYVDRELAEKVAAQLSCYIESDVASARLALDDPATLIWDLNSIITHLTHDLHFGYAKYGASSQSNSSAYRVTPHYLALSRMDPLNNENVRNLYIQALGQLKEPVILDLRGCIGGDADAVYFILCHFFPDKTPLFDLRSRHIPSRIFSAASSAPQYVHNNQIRKYTGALKVFVDTGTYSGGEIIAKILQTNGRAKVYGSNTPGAFNVTKMIKIDNLVLHLPFAAIIDSKTGKDYDKVGVIPDYPPASKEYIETVFTELTPHIFHTYT